MRRCKRKEGKEREGKTEKRRKEKKERKTSAKNFSDNCSIVVSISTFIVFVNACAHLREKIEERERGERNKSEKEN